MTTWRLKSRGSSFGATGQAANLADMKILVTGAACVPRAGARCAAKCGRGGAANDD